MPDHSSAPGLLWLHRAVVRPEWVDYNGHMSEAYYVLIFGDATDAFYDYAGLDDAVRRRDNVSVYTLEAHIRYLTEAHEGQEVRIGTRVLAYDAKRLRLHHAMLDPAGQVLAVTEIAALHVDKTGPRSCPFQKEIFARIAAAAASQADLPPAEPAMTRHWMGG